MQHIKATVFLLVLLVAQTMAQWQNCVGRPWLPSCNLLPHWGTRGPGCRPRVMWWYDQNMRSCRQMWYGGCGGNNNRWCTREACEQRCRR